jgi:hypothetical protein
MVGLKFQGKISMLSTDCTIRHITLFTMFIIYFWKMRFRFHVFSRRVNTLHDNASAALGVGGEAEAEAEAGADSAGNKWSSWAWLGAYRAVRDQNVSGLSSVS